MSIVTMSFNFAVHRLGGPPRPLPREGPPLDGAPLRGGGPRDGGPRGGPRGESGRILFDGGPLSYPDGLLPSGPPGPFISRSLDLGGPLEGGPWDDNCLSGPRGGPRLIGGGPLEEGAGPRDEYSLLDIP